MNRTSTRPYPLREPLIGCESGGANPAKITWEPRTEIHGESRLRRESPLQDSRVADGVSNESGTAEVIAPLSLMGETRAFLFAVRG